MVYASDFKMKSGAPNCLASCQASVFGHSLGAGMSLGSPWGAPASTQWAMAEIWLSLREISFWKSWIPTVLSKCHGGIWRVSTLSLMALAHGRVSSYVTSDIGAISPLRWQFWHFS